MPITKTEGAGPHCTSALFLLSEERRKVTEVVVVAVFGAFIFSLGYIIFLGKKTGAYREYWDEHKLNASDAVRLAAVLSFFVLPFVGAYVGAA